LIHFLRASKKYRMSRDFMFLSTSKQHFKTNKNDSDDETKNTCIGVLTKLFYNTSLEFQLRFLNMK
jgi:hypothetical protein